MDRACILYVNDEPEVLNSISMILERATYQVFTAASVSDAIRVLNSNHIDLVLFDCLPDRGWLAIEARRVNPQMRLLLYGGRIGASNLSCLDGVIQKPVSPVELLRAIDEVLHRGPADSTAGDTQPAADIREAALREVSPVMLKAKHQNS